MAQRKQSFRFRIPWLPSSGASEQLSRRPKDTSKSSNQLDTNVPIQRPSVITPAESPPSPSKTKEAPRTEPQNKSPPHPTQPTPSSVIIQSPVTTTQSKPPSPPSSHANASSPSHVKIVSSSPKTQPQSPSNLASDGAMRVPKPAAEESTHPAPHASQQEKEKMVVSEPMPQEAEPEMNVKSPLREITKSPETSFQPDRLSSQPAESERKPSSMPSSSPVSKTEPAASQPHHPSSPLASEGTKEELKANPEESTLPASSTSQEEKEKMAVGVPEQMPQEAEEPKMKSPLKIIPKSPEPSSQPENLSSQTKATLGDEERSISTTPKAPLETQNKFLQPEEKEKVVHETKKAGKAKDTTYSQPTPASTSGTKAKDSSAKGVRSDKKKHGARETVERKIMFATSNSSGKDLRVVSSPDPGIRNVSRSLSPERTVSSSEEKTPLQKGIKDDITKFVHKLTSVHQTQPMDDKQFSVITLAGDNRGATMHVGSESAKKEGSIHIHRAYKTDPEENTEVTTDVEENSDANEDSHSSDEVGKAYVNSNIQSINNSLLVHGSITERDPGVQVTLPQNPPEPIKPDDKGIHKTEFNISRAQRPTYQPTVRRRNLRGLFQEPSDPDPDNPDKPRHHGCKFSCDRDIEDIEIL